MSQTREVLGNSDENKSSTSSNSGKKRSVLIHGLPNLLSDFILFGPNSSSSSLIEKVDYFKPALDVIENVNEFKVICNVPGLSKENLKIDIDEEVRVLTISGKIEQEKTEENEKIHAMERCCGSFKRSIYLPKQANLEQVKAQLENGVLRIIISKSEEKKKIRTIRLSNL